MLTAKEMYHALRRGGCPPRPKPHPLRNLHYEINRRGEAGEVLRKNVENGKIAVYRHGMDCDCTAYDYASVVDAPKGAIQFLKEEDEHCEWLDGPETTRWGKPSLCEPFRESRDLVLEARENGHPHVVIWS